MLFVATWFVVTVDGRARCFPAALASLAVHPLPCTSLLRELQLLERHCLRVAFRSVVGPGC